MKKITKSLKLKMMVPLTVIVTLMLSFVVFMNVLSTQRAVLQVTNSLIEANSQAMANEIDTAVAKKKSLVEDLSSFLGGGKILDKDKTVEILSTYSDQIDNTLIDVYVGYPDKFYYMASGTDMGDSYDPTTRDWYIAATKSQEVGLTDPYFDSATNSLVVTAYKGMYVNGKFVAAVCADLAIDSIIDVAKNVNYADNVYAYIIDESGNYVYHPDTAKQLVSDDAVAVDANEASVLNANKVVEIEDYRGGKAFAYGGKLSECNWETVSVYPVANYVNVIKGLVTQSVVIFVVMIMIFLLAVGLLVNSIVKPIKAVSDATVQLANGELDCKVDVKSEDEVGTMAIAFNKAIDNLNRIVSDITSYLTELANKNYNLDDLDDYPGDFAPIAESLDAIIRALNETLGQIDRAGVEVNQGAYQIANAAQNLSQGSTEQASAVEELSATVNDIYEQTKKNTENAEIAASKVNAAGAAIKSSNEQMKQLTEAMEDMTNKSNEISKIVKTIEDIAFQTNILALNAAVEAARAGAAGKGFAVVADEVRNLATKSSEAASETTKLIGETIDAINNGSKLATGTAETLNTVADATSEVVSVVNSISEASETQASSVAQVTEGINQVNVVVQTNAATAEESAAASEELSGQANMLKELLSEFNLRD